MQKKIKQLLNNYEENGFCILKLLNEQDLEYFKNKIINQLSIKKSNKNVKLEKYHKMVDEDSHKMNMKASYRYIPLNQGIKKKLYDNFLKTLAIKNWGHSKFKFYWVGDTKKKELKVNNTGFRISRPTKALKVDDSAGVHLDKNLGGEIREELDLVLTLWIPIIGFSDKYTLRIAPKSHLVDHNVAYLKSNKITPIIKKEYEDKFRFIRPKMKKGEVLVIHPNLLHGGSENLGINSRVSLDIRAINSLKIKNI